MRRLSSLLKKCFTLEHNFISENEEQQLLKEINQKIKYIRWSEGHFDRKIINYREYLATDIMKFDSFSQITKARINAQMMGKDLLPVHILELKKDGLILPHIDNINYSGSIIAGLSLQRDGILTFSDSKESESIELPRRSFYRLM